LVTAHVPEGSVAKIKDSLKTRGAAKLEDRPGDWTAEGWVSLEGSAVMPPPGAGAMPSSMQI
jgi:hypothetical protein